MGIAGELFVARRRRCPASPPPRASISPRKPHARDPCYYSDRLLAFHLRPVRHRVAWILTLCQQPFDLVHDERPAVFAINVRSALRSKRPRTVGLSQQLLE